MASRRLFRALYGVGLAFTRARLAFVRGRVRHDWVRNRWELIKPLGGRLYVVRTWKG